MSSGRPDLIQAAVDHLDAKIKIEEDQAADKAAQLQQLVDLRSYMLGLQNVARQLPPPVPAPRAAEIARAALRDVIQLADKMLAAQYSSNAWDQLRWIRNRCVEALKFEA